MGSASERTEQKDAGPLGKLVPDYALFGPSPKPWYRQAIDFLEKRASPDVAVLVTVGALAYVDVKLVEVSDRMTVSGAVSVLGVSVLIAAVGLTAYLRRPTDGQNCEKGADPPADDRPD